LPFLNFLTCRQKGCLLLSFYIESFPEKTSLIERLPPSPDEELDRQFSIRAETLLRRSPAGLQDLSPWLSLALCWDQI